MRLFRKIRVQLVVIMLLCYLVPAVVLGYYMGGVLIEDLRIKTESALKTGMEYSRMLTEENLQKLIALAREATYDGELTDAVARRDSGELPESECLRLSRNYIERKYSREAMVSFAACFTLDNPDLLMFNRSGHEDALAYQAKAHAAVKALGENLDTQCRFMEVDGRLYLVRNLLNLRMQRYGMLVLGVRTDQLLRPLYDIAGRWDARVDVRLDDMDGVDLTGTGLEEGAMIDWDGLPEGSITPASVGRYAFQMKGTGRDYRLRMGLLIGRKRLYGEIDSFRLLLAGLLLLLIPILAVMAWYVYRRITKPIALLSDAAHRIESGELGVTVPMRGDDELGRLGQAFSNMSLRLEELIDKTYKEEIALRDARIQAMQSRINPHFINNALETINWQARIDNSQTISAMVESLSVLLNAGMSRNNQRMVTLREELEVADAYFYFVGLRFGDRLKTRVDVPPDAMPARLPVLTLQPLIENAVEHGIAPADGGEIELTCRVSEACLAVRVTNSGRPMDAGDRQRVQAAMRGDNQGGTHLGLSNISQRLSLIYGGRARMQVASDDEGRTVVTLEIPLED